MPVFNTVIDGWTSWGEVFQSIEAFEPLIRLIMRQEGLPEVEITHLTPGTNAVFRIGAYVIKIFAPQASGLNTDSDYVTELFGMERAGALGLRLAALLASGTVNDRYVFRYMVMEYVQGTALGTLHPLLAPDEKRVIGQKMADICRRMNTASARFNSVNVAVRAREDKKWSGFSETLQAERLAFIDAVPGQGWVYAHGDLTADNVMLTPEGELCLLDFADAVIAPPSYELPALFCDAFSLDRHYLEGFCEGMTLEKAMQACVEGLLLHDFGADIIRHALGDVEDIHSVVHLRNLLFRRLYQNAHC